MIQIFKVPVVTLSRQDKSKLLQQLKSDFWKTIKRNEYQSKVSTHTRNQYLDYLFNPSFYGVNIVFVLSYENNAIEKVKTKMSRLMEKTFF